MDTNTENKREVSHEVKRLEGASKTASEAFVNIFILIMNQREGGRLDASPSPQELVLGCSMRFPPCFLLVHFPAAPEICREDTEFFTSAERLPPTMPGIARVLRPFVDGLLDL